MENKALKKNMNLLKETLTSKYIYQDGKGRLFTQRVSQFSSICLVHYGKDVGLQRVNKQSITSNLPTKGRKVPPATEKTI